MFRTNLVTTVVFLATSLFPPTARAGKPLQDTVVTTSLVGFGADTVPTMRLQSDQLGPYVNTNTVLSHIQGSGDYELITNSASTPTRKVLFDFRDAIPGGLNPTPPFSFQTMPARFICKGGAYATDMQAMYGVGTIGYCALSPLISSRRWDQLSNRYGDSYVPRNSASFDYLRSC